MKRLFVKHNHNLIALQMEVLGYYHHVLTCFTPCVHLCVCI